MNYYISTFTLLLLAMCCSCNSSEKTQEPSLKFITASKKRTVEKKELQLSANEGIQYFQGIPFTGTAFAYHKNGTLSESIEYQDGKRNGKRRRWYVNGQVSLLEHYQNNRLEGTKTTFWKNGNARSIAHFRKGLAHGIQQQWYQNGSIFKELHLTNGKEVGLQRAWRGNGDLYCNYEVKNGRVYGLKKSTLCFELTDELVKF